MVTESPENRGGLGIRIVIDRTLPKRRDTSAVVTEGQNKMTGVKTLFAVIIF